jgi:hypothetical protein
LESGGAHERRLANRFASSPAFERARHIWASHNERVHYLMAKIAPVFSGIVRYGGVLVLILGILLWTGNFDAITPFHMLLGIIVVLSLWALAAAHALTGKANIGLIVAAVLLGLFQAIFGTVQAGILAGPNDPHWIVQVIHLLFGLSIIGLGERITAENKRIAKAAAA